MEPSEVRSKLLDISSAIGAIKTWTSDRETWAAQAHGWQFIAILVSGRVECTATKAGLIVRLPPELRERVKQSIEKTTTS